MSEDGQRWGILGGTFDPPHLAHVALAAAARDALHLDTVLFVPAGDPWRKAGKAISPASHRLAMVQAAVEDLPWAEVSAIEIERNGPTYTLDTVSELSKRGGTWWFIVGEDALHDMPRWHEPHRLIASIRLAVARRDLDVIDAVQQPLLTPDLLVGLPGIADRVDEVPMPLLDISASDIRARITGGLPTDDVLDAKVRAYIDEHGLYRE